MLVTSKRRVDVSTEQRVDFRLRRAGAGVIGLLCYGATFQRVGAGAVQGDGPRGAAVPHPGAATPTYAGGAEDDKQPVAWRPFQPVLSDCVVLQTPNQQRASQCWMDTGTCCLHSIPEALKLVLEHVSCGGVEDVAWRNKLAVLLSVGS